MKWNISLKLEQGEEFIEKQEDVRRFGLKAVYTPMLTNKRALFRFNSLSTNMVGSFEYSEITDVQPVSRLLIKYLKISTKGKDHLLHVDNPEEWARKIKESRERFRSNGMAAPAARRPSLPELLAMIETLKESGILSPDEFEAKRRMILM